MLRQCGDEPRKGALANGRPSVGGVAGKRSNDSESVGWSTGIRLQREDAGRDVVRARARVLVSTCRVPRGTPIGAEFGRTGSCGEKDRDMPDGIMLRVRTAVRTAPGRGRTCTSLEGVRAVYGGSGVNDALLEEVDSEQESSCGLLAEMIFTVNRATMEERLGTGALAGVDRSEHYTKDDSTEKLEEQSMSSPEELGGKKDAKLYASEAAHKGHNEEGGLRGVADIGGDPHYGVNVDGWGRTVDYVSSGKPPTTPDRAEFPLGRNKTSNALAYVVGTQHPKEVIPNERSRLIESGPSSGPPSPAALIVDHQKLNDKLGTIVRRKESKMVNVSARAPFTLHAASSLTNTSDERHSATSASMNAPGFETNPPTARASISRRPPVLMMTPARSYYGSLNLYSESQQSSPTGSRSSSRHRPEPRSTSTHSQSSVGSGTGSGSRSKGKGKQASGWFAESESEVSIEDQPPSPIAVARPDPATTPKDAQGITFSWGD
ncbi:hypothetical protein C8R43DRAFT_956752 [Mycena crocata]|nr:hypothetical protein C8R43DRAFT_956752 [Mycena crocata]